MEPFSSDRVQCLSDTHKHKHTQFAILIHRSVNTLKPTTPICAINSHAGAALYSADTKTPITPVYSPVQVNGPETARGM